MFLISDIQLLIAISNDKSNGKAILPLTSLSTMAKKGTIQPKKTAKETAGDVEIKKDDVKGKKPRKAAARKSKKSDETEVSRKCYKQQKSD